MEGEKIAQALSDQQSARGGLTWFMVDSCASNWHKNFGGKVTTMDTPPSPNGRMGDIAWTWTWVSADSLPIQ